MNPEKKTIMVSLRLPKALVARADFLARNTPGDLETRSAVIRTALESWLPAQELGLEQRLEQLGTPSKKVR